ncbi:DUF4064 domain-containing protein [Tumebacillus sp. ITR2]|uniref:DUF4064 domain-containing protein n=1 Tax=Tumebacillus amylolyticus TaxID=2801339 RepID=A0ABS1J864_9BACL|nr:DUF4064 domain-containing protein [Tumebacillus amylolyticus]MBL0386477.1 DUF4064 domain-containing protein [Tumebacillus amylolyticus]
MKRTAEFVMGLIGGIVGILCGFSGVLLGSVAASLQVDGSGTVSTASWIAIAVSVLGIVGAGIVKKSTKLGSLFMLIAAVVGFICISFFYTVPAILFLIAGIMGFARKGKGAVA